MGALRGLRVGLRQRGRGDFCVVLCSGGGCRRDGRGGYGVGWEGLARQGGRRGVLVACVERLGGGGKGVVGLLMLRLGVRLRCGRVGGQAVREGRAVAWDTDRGGPQVSKPVT